MDDSPSTALALAVETALAAISPELWDATYEGEDDITGDVYDDRAPARWRLIATALEFGAPVLNTADCRKR